MRQSLFTHLIAGLMLAGSPFCSQAGQSGQAGHDNVLLGMHFMDFGNEAARDLSKVKPVDVYPMFSDYLEYMPEDLAHYSYADFWRWWCRLERYKGDEKGLEALDDVVESCLARGMKVKVDLAHCTWWSLDRDWTLEKSSVMIGTQDLDDWVHLCDRVGRRYKGRIALWLLQGEANPQLYWEDKKADYVQEVYRLGYRAFKRVDSNVMISSSGASPGEGFTDVFGKTNGREAMDNWYRQNLTACKGYYDDTSMNYFADVQGADPYNGLNNYYDSVRRILDEIGQKEAEIGSGESSVQWALSSYEIKPGPQPWTSANFDPAKANLSEIRQAWRMNESLGYFFTAGGNKFMWWGTEFAPGGGWHWRWGFRKYQDWWGIWPEANKIPGTNIVYRYDNPDGRKVDLRPHWSSKPTDPRHPLWEVFKFWAQATPPGAEAVRLSVGAVGEGPGAYGIATYLRSRDRCIALIQSDKKTAVSLKIDLRKTGWPEGTPLVVRVRCETIDYATGDNETNSETILEERVVEGAVAVARPAKTGFTTIDIERLNPAWDGECVREFLAEAAEAGRPSVATLVLRNTGSKEWKRNKVSLEPCGMNLVGKEPDLGKGSPVAENIKPGGTAAVRVAIPACDAPGRETRFYRLRDPNGEWFGPVFPVSADVVELDAPRKMVAHRELGHVRLKWFAPERGDSPSLSYEIHRADGFEKPFALLKKVEGMEFVDTPPEKDKAYYYFVRAIDPSGRASRPSNEDNAKALSKPRIYDAEVTAHTIPAQVRMGEETSATITLKNTGTKAWDPRPGPDGKKIVFLFAAMRLWEEQDEARLPKMAIDRVVEPGDSVTLTLPYVATQAGRHENHWILVMDAPGRERAYFGTPLLVETVAYTR